MAGGATVTAGHGFIGPGRAAARRFYYDHDISWSFHCSVRRVGQTQFDGESCGLDRAALTLPPPFPFLVAMAVPVGLQVNRKQVLPLFRPF